ncbi:hypothetical protein Bca4012_076457 [Brassica carinata]|uniref:GRF-type domain-containing protein n=1 Tax=Brassica carinata TaxID=52824 RepID=A0A8X7U4Z3_BRACI|nr:hypothetical protein Bca52824_073181 [Brassica carinata]
MSQSVKASSSSTSGGGSWRHRRGERERGFPKFCRCGEEAVIKTSGTTKNPGRLFHCCPYGSEEYKSRLFSWTDECMVEEIYDLKEMASDLKGEISELRGEMGGLQNDIERGKMMIESEKNMIGCCVVL